jgi:histidine phosphotransferase ChpT
MSLDSHLARLLAARLCHDLGGAIGSLSGTLDLVGQGDPEMLSLSRETAASLRQRLKLFAVCWGGPTTEYDGQAIGALLLGAPASPRVQFTVDALSPARPVPAGLVPLVLNAALLAAEALPRGGIVHLAGSADAGFTILPQGRNLAWPAGLLQLLAGHGVQAAMEDGPRRVVVPLLLALAEEQGWALSLAMGAGPAAPLVLSPA